MPRISEKLTTHNESQESATDGQTACRYFDPHYSDRMLQLCVFVYILPIYLAVSAFSFMSLSNLDGVRRSQPGDGPMIVPGVQAIHAVQE